MSPEQARGEAHQADRRTDIYSLGVVLFQLPTGELPFRGNARMIVQQVLVDEPPSPGKLNRHAPRDLETITLKCLEKEPKRRFQTAADLADELDRFLRTEPIRSRPITLGGRVWRWCRRRPTLAALGAAVLLLLLAVTIVSTVAAARVSASRGNERRANYYRSIQLAQKQIQDAAIDSARQTLMDCPPELRHWEWGHLMLQCHQDIAQFKSAPGSLQQFLFSPNSKVVVMVDGDGALRVWDWLDRRQVFQAGGVTNRVQEALLSGAGLLAVLFADGDLQLWSPSPWELRRKVRLGESRLMRIGFTDNEHLLSASISNEGKLFVRDIVANQSLYTLQLPSGTPAALSFSPGAIVNRLQAIPGFSHGTVVSVHRNELEALIEDAHLRSGCSEMSRDDPQTPVFILPLAVCRKRGEHVRLSDLVDDHSDTQLMPRSLRLRLEV